MYILYVSFRLQVDVSVSAEAHIFEGFKFGLKVDTDIFDSHMTSQMKFGNKTYTFTSGGPDLPGKNGT